MMPPSKMVCERIRCRVPWRLRALADAARERTLDVMLLPLVRRLPLPASVAQRRVILVGASVGRAWRLHLVFPRVQALAIYQFDKTPAVKKAISHRPDAIMIKECAAYFPCRSEAEADHGRGLVAAWVRQVRHEGIRPVLATVVPVTRPHSRQVPGRAEGLWAFNDWLRRFADREQVLLLDLEAALHISSTQRYLDDALDSGDGLHLSWRTYREKLDPLIPPLLLRTFAGT